MDREVARERKRKGKRTNVRPTWGGKIVVNLLDYPMELDDFAFYRKDTILKFS
jgi:hypothetical protein